ncbi:MAG TPA: esterase [Planctomycetaceae bacterium]|nr:esterase [Planctomycetaceae bacterium]
MSGRRLTWLFLFLLVPGTSWSQIERYPAHPDSLVKEGVPQGQVHEFEWTSQIFPGTKRRYSVYVPAQYDQSEPAAVMVFQDGHAYVNPEGDFRAGVVMDNLIHAGQMPVTIGIFIDPGHDGQLPPKRGWTPTPNNRSFEYDTLSDQYARFLLEEILPEVGSHYRLTEDAQMRAIAGMSSGGICAWTVAWQRPDKFTKVMSHIGSFVDIRGGDKYPSMVRKTEKKPIRVFLQDGSGDLDNSHGNWPLANQQMAKALAFKGYDFDFVYGEGKHNGRHGGSIFPDSMRWLWRTGESASN